MALTLQQKIDRAGEAFDRFARDESERRHEPATDKLEHPTAPQGILREWHESGIGNAYERHFGMVL